MRFARAKFIILILERTIKNMINPLLKFLLFVVLSATFNASAGSTIGKIGPWKIFKNKDSMSDTVRCSAVYLRDAKVMMVSDMLTVSMRDSGGLKSYQFRFDSELPSMMSEPLPSETDGIWWTGDMDRVKAAKRFRIRVVTYLGTIVDVDVDLTRAKEVHQRLLSPQCTS